MKNTKGIIIDDEQGGRDVLQKLILQYTAGVEIVAEAKNITEAYEAILLHKPDFILLDIQMPGGSGFDLLRRFDTINFEIIFVTSYDKFAINAFKYSASDYLLKPVEIDDLVSAIEKVKNKKINNFKDAQEKVIVLLDNMDADGTKKSIALQKGDKVFYIKLNEIVYIESDSNYSNIFILTGESFISSKTLKYYEDLFAEKKEFMRISKSIIINLNQIKSYSKSEPCILSLNDGSTFEISRRKKSDFLKIMSEL